MSAGSLETLELFDSAGMRVARVTVPAGLGSVAKLIIYSGRHFILEAGRYVEALPVQAKAAQNV